MESDHDLSFYLHRFSESIPIAIMKLFLAATCCSLLQQQSSLSPALHISNSPSRKSRRPGGRGRRGRRWRLPRQTAGLHCSTLAPSCPLLHFTGLLIDPAATEYWKLIGYRIWQWCLNFGRSSLGLQYACTSGQALTTTLVGSVCAGYVPIIFSRTVCIRFAREKGNSRTIGKRTSRG